MKKQKLTCPIGINGRVENDDVCLILRDDETERAELTFCDLRFTGRGFSWLIFGKNTDGRTFSVPYFGPDTFSSLNECVHNAIAHIREHEPCWENSIPALQAFLSVNVEVQ